MFFRIIVKFIAKPQNQRSPFNRPFVFRDAEHMPKHKLKKKNKQPGVFASFCGKKKEPIGGGDPKKIKYFVRVVQRMHYKVTLLFFWLNDVNLAIKRVEKRVLEGGHHIPEEVVRRRYIKGIENLLLFTACANYWLVIDNSDGLMHFVAEGNLKEEITIFEQEIWTKII